MKDGERAVVPFSAATGPERGTPCKVTIETPDMDFVWEGRFWDVEMENDYVTLTRVDGQTEYLPTTQHFRLHLIKPR